MTEIESDDEGDNEDAEGRERWEEVYNSSVYIIFWRA
jgi:hypothetical protein